MQIQSGGGRKLWEGEIIFDRQTNTRREEQSKG